MRLEKSISFIWLVSLANRAPLNDPLEFIKVLCEQTRELTHDFLDYV